jgi:hypothetical protein
MEFALVSLFLFASVFAIIYGGIKTFRRNWILALILLLLLTGIWVIWAIVECFTSAVPSHVYNVNVVNDVNNKE